MALTYRNGYVPRSATIVFGSGRDSFGRYYEWRLPPRTYRKHLALVARALKRTGRRLSPSQGWSCDRPIAEQVFARQIHGLGAADPGSSSHGGNWAGPVTNWVRVDTAAIDYHNWAWVYEKYGDRARAEFFADCRAVGLTPGGIARPAFPDEPWHVIDLDDPYGPLPAGTEAEPFPTTTPDEGEEIMMRARSTNTGHWYVFGPLGVIIIRSGAKDSANYKKAVAYNTALGGESFPKMSSADLTLLIEDWEGMRVEFFQAMGNTAAVKKIRADVAQVLALETGAPDPVTASEVEAIVSDLLQDAVTGGLTKAEIGAAVRDALDGASIQFEAI